MARCLAVAISQAPGVSGIPDTGHCTSAATSASCTSSSAMPTSRTTCVTPAMIRPYSMRTTASTASDSLVAVTPPIRPAAPAPGKHGGGYPSAISRTSAVTVQNSSWHWRNRLVHSRASALSLAWRMAYPPTTSLVSVKGPSV